MSLLKKYEHSEVHDKPPEFNIEGNILKGKIEPMDVPKEGLGHLILHHLTTNPDIIGQINVDDGRQYTFAEIRDLSVKCAKWLVEHNVKPGDIISVFSYNQSELFVPLLACLFAGAIFAPISYGITTKNVEYYLNLMEPKFIFVSEDSVELVAEAIRNANKKTELIVFGSAAGCYEFDDTIKCKLTASNDFECVRIPDITRTVFILFSSGTTGLSKGVELSHETVMKSLIRFEVWGSDFSRSLWYSSVSWISGVVMTLNAIIKGATKIFHKDFEPAKFCRIIEQYEVTYAILSPTMMYQLCKANIVTNYSFSHLKTLATTGAKIRKSVMDYFVQSLPNLCVHQIYGMTELGGVMTFPSRDKKKKDSIGTVSWNVEIKVVDQESQENVGTNRLGELYFKSPYLMKGYYKNPEETFKTVDKATGWLQSGDLGFYDEDGYVFIVDRLKEILKVKSHHVSPVEIEHVLMQHPGVEEAVVVGVPHETDIDHPIAFVTKAPGGQVTKEELLELAASIGDFHRLRAGVVFLDKIPQTASMKIDRKKIRELAKSYAKI